MKARSTAGDVVVYRPRTQLNKKTVFTVFLLHQLFSDIRQVELLVQGRPSPLSRVILSKYDSINGSVQIQVIATQDQFEERVRCSPIGFSAEALGVVGRWSLLYICISLYERLLISSTCIDRRPSFNFDVYCHSEAIALVRRLSLLCDLDRSVAKELFKLIMVSLSCCVQMNDEQLVTYHELQYRALSSPCIVTSWSSIEIRRSGTWMPKLVITVTRILCCFAHRFSSRLDERLPYRTAKNR